MTAPKDPKVPKVDFGRNPFEFYKEEPFARVKLVGDMDFDLAREFEKRMKPQLDGLDSDLVLDLSECGKFNPAWTRPLMGIAAHQKKCQKRLKVVTSQKIHREFFQEQGLTASLPVVSDLSAATREITYRKPTKIDVTFINPFLEATVDVLKKQAGIAAKPGLPSAREFGAPLDGDVTGVIALESVEFLGSVLISFPESTYLKLISTMLGEGHEAITVENRDGASEITNIVFGQAKRVLNEKGQQVKMAIPTVVVGRTPPGLPAITGARIAVPFESDAGPFTVEIRAQAT